MPCVRWPPYSPRTIGRAASAGSPPDPAHEARIRSSRRNVTEEITMRTDLTATLISTAAGSACGGGLRAGVASDGPKPAKANVVTVTTVDYAFQAPDTIAAG